MRLQAYIFLFLVILSVLMNGCSSTKNTLTKTDGTSEIHLTLSYLAGITAGGLVENNTMEGINAPSALDAISGATKSRFNIGVHKEIKFKELTLETGLDYLAFEQTITYDMPSFSLDGQRSVRFSQLRLPVTCNFHFFKGNNGHARFILKAGFSIGYTVSKSISDAGTVPEYTFKNRDYGPTLGMAFFPISLMKNYRIGVYVDLFRGSRIYEDRFHTTEGMGGQSYMKFGIVLQPHF